MLRDELIEFENRIAEEFNQAKIPYPVHLESGNEDQLIKIFKHIRSRDWIFGTWRLHLKALLKGVPKEELRAAIYRGESMALSFPQYRVYGSAIAGGTISIALGVALSIKRKGKSDMVWCFLGDMMSYSGIFHEALTYSRNHELPIQYIIEDNGVSVCTDTKKVWNGESKITDSPYVKRFTYESRWPHCGSGTRVNF